MLRGLVIFGAIAIVLIILFGNTEEVFGVCIMSYCKHDSMIPASTRSYITNTHRQIVGDLYSPGRGQRVQVRNKHRQIIGYIEVDGSITNIYRQKIGEINE